jgi:hypothetical protein
MISALRPRYRETAEEAADFNTVVDDLMAGLFNNPIRVIAFNVGEGWSRDVSDHVASELLKRVAKEDKPLGCAARRFVEFHSAKRNYCAPELLTKNA